MLSELLARTIAASLTVLLDPLRARIEKLEANYEHVMKENAALKVVLGVEPHNSPRQDGRAHIQH